LKKLEIDQKLLSENIETVKKKSGGARVIAVLKANGYGVGTLNLAGALKSGGIDFFAVTDLPQAVMLRENGFEDDILCLTSTCVKEDLEIIVTHNLTATIGSYEAGRLLDEVCASKGKRVNAHMEIDTGFGRSGFSHGDPNGIVSAFSSFSNIDITGVYSHLSCSFGKKKFTDRQMEKFIAVKNVIQEKTEFNGLYHIASSNALFKYPDTVLDAVRVGSAFIGRVAAGNTGLKSIGALKTDIKEVKRLPKGHNIGYGNVYKTKRAVTIAVVSLGYSDGISMERAKGAYRLRDKLRYIYNDIFLSDKNAPYGTINGKKAKLLGRSGQTSLVLDVTDIQCNAGNICEFAVNPMFISADIERVLVD